MEVDLPDKYPASTLYGRYRRYSGVMAAGGAIGSPSCVAPRTHASAGCKRSSVSQNRSWSDATDTVLSDCRGIASLRIEPLGRGRSKQRAEYPERFESVCIPENEPPQPSPQ